MATDAPTITIAPIEDSSEISDEKEPIFDIAVGYPDSLFIDQEKAKEFFCIECGDLPRDPWELACGHGSVCRQPCGSEVKCEREAQCQLVVENSNKIEKSTRATRNKIGNLEMKCLRHAAGCEWQGPVKDWDGHVEHECEYARVPCEDCAIDGVAQIHLRRVELEGHKAECKKFECALKKNEINCQSGGRMNEAEYLAHREEAHLDHIDAIGESLCKTKLNMEDRINSLQEQNRNLQEEVDRLKQEAEEREEKVNSLSNEMDGLFQTINALNTRLACVEYINDIIGELPLQAPACQPIGGQIEIEVQQCNNQGEMGNESEKENTEE